jgi:hypothetical protein
MRKRGKAMFALPSNQRKPSCNKRHLALLIVVSIEVVRTSNIAMHNVVEENSSENFVGVG